MSHTQKHGLFTHIGFNGLEQQLKNNENKDLKLKKQKRRKAQEQINITNQLDAANENSEELIQNNEVKVQLS